MAKDLSLDSSAAGLQTAPAASKPGVRVWLAWMLRRPRLFLCLLVLLAALPGLFAMPPLDRDESRFAQATAQMLESGDFVSIYFQDEPRNKKPVGIHWLQAASVWLTSNVADREIWAYRLPSLAGALLATLLTFSIGQTLFGRREGLLAGALLGTCIVLTVEAVNAKTDAMLLFSVVAVQLALARLWAARDEGPRPGIGTALVFWAALGFGILIKGPLTPLVAGLTVLALSISTRRWAWLAPLRPLIGIPVMLAIALPWFLAITLQDKTFLLRAANEDFIPKLLSGVESHGQPPGFYLGVHILGFWPGALFALPALVAAWLARRRVGALPFLLAWLIPAWLVFELTPTKLPHYTLPTYPALALLVAWAVFAGEPWLRGRLAKLLAVIAMVGGLALGLGVVWLALELDAVQAVGPAVIVGLLAFATGAGAGYLSWRGRPLTALVWSVPMTALVMAWGMGFYVPRLQPLWLSPQIVAAYDAAKQPGTPPLASAGYHEPSLIFLTDKATALLSAGAAAGYLADDPKALVAVTARQNKDFQETVAAKGVTAVPRAELSGINYSKGRKEAITLYGRDR
ncbi:MAG: glycosyltransferase family 39 protein [Rhodospirillales bacterium]